MSDFPQAALEQHIAVLGKTGSGKTTAVKSVVVEPLLERGARVAVIDPTSAWWGLRTSRNGKAPAFPVLVLGGDHGDLPLPANGGAAIARLVVEQGVNLVADTSQLTVGERTRWFIDFASTVHRMNRAPLHLVIDEAHNFAPQGKVLDPDAGKMLHAANRLAAEGRSRGIRLTLITQRPQKLHKDALTSADTLIALRVIAPHDRAAIKEWIDGAAGGGGSQVLQSLAELARGEGWVWYPEGGFLERMRFPAITTFDSSATPTGDAVQAPKAAASIDLPEIRKALAEAVKEAEANDPKVLRAEIESLKKLANLRATSLNEPDPAALEAARVAGYAQGLSVVGPALERMKTLAAGLAEAVEHAQRDVAKMQERAAASPAPRKPDVRQMTYKSPATPAKVRNVAMPRDPAINGPMQRILDALAWWEAAGVTAPTRTQVAVVARYSPSGGAFQNPLGALRTAGLVDYPAAGTVMLTPEGSTKAQASGQPVSTAELHERVRAILNGPQQRILDPLLEAYPREMTREELAAAAGYEASGGAFQNPLGSLRSLGLIDYPGPGRVVALPILFVQ